MCTRLCRKMFIVRTQSEFESYFSRRSGYIFFFGIKHFLKVIFICYCRCEFLIRMKGQDFVDEIQARYPHLLEQVSKFLYLATLNSPK